MSIRGIQEDTYTVIDYTAVMQSDGAPKMLEEIEVSRAMFEAFEGAVVSSWTCFVVVNIFLINRIQVHASRVNIHR